MTTWLVGRMIPEAMFRDATNIFAFDALIQNPDRRVANPNLFTQGDSIYVYDHEETSFSFLLALSPSTEPWNLERETYLEDHVFYSRLRAKEIDLKDFGQNLKALTTDVLMGIREEVPLEWAHKDLIGIEGHLTKIQKNADEFVEQIRRRLA
jgi:RNAse (barnase) inhibitor barstar